MLDLKNKSVAGLLEIIAQASGEYKQRLGEGSRDTVVVNNITRTLGVDLLKLAQDGKMFISGVHVPLQDIEDLREGLEAHGFFFRTIGSVGVRGRRCLIQWGPGVKPPAA